MNNNEEYRNEETREEMLSVATDSLVHFAEGNAPLFVENGEDDGVAEEVVRTAYLCMTETAC